MTAVQTITEVLTEEEASSLPSSADLAVAAFLARYSGRTFEAYRHDLRTYFQWASDAGLEVFSATRGHIELYRATLEERGLAATTIDRRLSTVCGSTASRTSTVASGPIRLSTCADLGSSSTRCGAWTGVNSAPFSSPPSASTGPTPPLPSSWASTGSGSARPVPPMSKTWG